MGCGKFSGVIEGDNLGVRECESPTGGHKTVQPPGFQLNVTNPPVTEECWWQDDDGQLVQEDTGSVFCIDNV